MYKSIAVQNKVVSPENLFIISEVGNQFGGSFETAIELCHVAAKAGADAIKFIFWFPDEIMAEDTPYTYETANGAVTETSMKALLDRFRLSISEWSDIRMVCQNIGIVMMSTVLSSSGVDYAREIDLPAYKISSWDYNYLDLWRWIAREQKPTFIDTGPARLHEIAQCLRIMEEEHNNQYVLLHCFHTTRYSDMNMMAIPYMAQVFDCLVGYSSADLHDETDITAVSLGACVLEKRVTLSRQGGVLHDAVSKEPDEFKEYVKLMRNVKESLGQGYIKPSQGDLDLRKKYFRRVVADPGISEGQTITYENMGVKRGERGISPIYTDIIVGRCAKRTLKPNETIEWEDIQ